MDIVPDPIGYRVEHNQQNERLSALPVCWQQITFPVLWHPHALATMQVDMSRSDGPADLFMDVQ